jgi:predicted nuclease of predicted toxin-antitoxin system
LRLLFDQNLAPRLVARLADVFPASEHVRDAGLAAGYDQAVWEYAKAGGFAIVSKDADFRQLSFLYGSPLPPFDLAFDVRRLWVDPKPTET